MKKLKYKPFKGLQIICTKCRKTIHNKSESKKGCKHPIEYQRYKIVAIIPNTGGKRTSKNLVSKTYDEAVREALNFEQELRDITSPVTKPQLLIDTISMFADYLENADVPAHKVKIRTDDYSKTTIKYLQRFADFLKTKKFNMRRFRIQNVTDAHVGEYHHHLESLNQSNYTYNAHIKALRTWFNFLIKSQYQIINVWSEVRQKPENSTNQSILKKDFEDLLSVITPEDSIKKFGKTSRNMYRSWLVSAIQLKLFTGRRNAEIFEMRWSMVIWEKGVPVVIKSPNIKVNRQKNNFKEKDYEYAYIPIGKELIILLESLGIHYKKGSNDYIINPDNQERKDLHKRVGRMFTFYWKKLDRPYTINLKHLRQTYVTAESMYFPRITLQHSSYTTTEKHYLDKMKIAKTLALNGFQIFD